MHNLGIGGATLAGAKSLFPQVLTKLKAKKFSLDILDIGSNDPDPIRRRHINVQTLAGELVTQAH